MALILSHAYLVKGPQRIDGGEDPGLAELSQVVVRVANGQRVWDGEAIESSEIHTPPYGVSQAVSNLFLHRHQREGPG